MKKTIATLAVGAVMLTGCSGEDKPKEAGGRTLPKAPATFEEAPEDRMYYVVQELEAGLTKDEATMYAISACGYMEKGYSGGETMITMMSETGDYDPMLHAGLVGGSVGSFCPQYAQKLSREFS